MVSVRKYNFNKLYKIIALVVAAIFAARFFPAKDSIYYVEHLNTSNPSLTAVAMCSIWLAIVGLLLFCINAFIDLDITKLCLRYFGLPIALFNAVMCWNTAIHIDATAGYRYVLYFVEAILLLAGCIYVVINQRKVVTTKKDILYIIILSISMIIACLPTYAIKVLFGSGPLMQIDELNIPHRIMLYIGFVAPFILYFALKKRSYNMRNFAMIYLSLGTGLSFLTSVSGNWLDPTLWPLHLCNTAMMILPICLIFRTKKLFYFTYFINVLGAFLALLMPNYADKVNLFSASVLNFYINHWIAFFMPLLLVALGLFERPNIKSFRYSMGFFAIYFVSMLILNAWFSNYNAGVDFFFLNSDFVADKLGPAIVNLRNFTWEFQLWGLNFKFYPVYQAVFYVVYCVAGLAMWFIYELGFSMSEQLQDQTLRKKVLRMEHLRLIADMKGRPVQQPLVEEAKDMIVIKHFSKKYGDFVAVDDLNLEINAGEVFGFLGHNGAGKSTTIKSLVGIQTITSGTMLVCGYDVARQPVEAKMHIGYVPDHYALYEKLTGRQYVNYVADLYNVSQEQRDKYIEQYVTQLDLTDAFDKPMSSYSHGMKQKITIISALVHQPKVWILDEPLTGLDPTSIYQIKEIMKDYAKAGNIVFFSSHIIDLVEKICTKIAVIRHGKLQLLKSIEDINKEGISLEELYISLVSAKDEDNATD